MAIDISFTLFENAYKLRAVTNPTPLKAGKFKFTDDGLYSEVVFGPSKRNMCSCGNVFSKEHIGVRCSECDVLCDTNELRSSTFGRIDLPKNIYVVLPVFQTLLQSIFGQTAIKSLLNYTKYENNVEKPYQYSITQKKLVKKNLLKKGELRITKDIYDITTLHILYNHLLKTDNLKSLILDHMSDPVISKYVFVNFILVIPPDSRPLIKLNKQYQAHPISAAYTEILKNIKNSFLDKLYQTQSEGFGLTVYKYQKSINKLYEEIKDKNFQRKESIVRESLAGKTVETSQRATIVPEPILAPGSIGLHEETIKKIFQPELLHFINEKHKNDRLADFVRGVHEQTNKNGDVEITPELFEEFIDSKGSEFRMLLERPPVLWRYNLGGALLGAVYNDNKHIGIKQDRVTSVNSLIAQMYNLDYDGDNLSVYALTSEQSKSAFKYAYMENSVEFEHNQNLIVSMEHESIYAAYMLSTGCDKRLIRQYDVLEYDTLDDFVVSIDDINRTPSRPVKIGDVTLPYNAMAINKAINLNKIVYDNTYKLTKKNLNKLLKLIRVEINDSNFYTIIHNFDKFLLECSTVIQVCNPTFALNDFAIGSESITDYKKTLINEPYIAFHQNDILFQDIVGKEVANVDDGILKPVIDSGARIKNVQVLKAVSNNGIPTNIYGKAFKENIKSSLLEGLTKREFYMGGDSARLALAQRQEAIPKGGELQRKFYYSTGFLRLSDDDDCGSTKGLSITIKNKTHLESFYSRYLLSGEEIDISDLSLIGQTLDIRTPVFCKSSKYEICTKCFGHKKPQSKALGASIGSYLSESIIQSVLRTHHFSGAFITDINPDLISAIKTLKFESPNKIYFDNEQDVLDLEKIMHHDKYYGESGHIEFVKQNENLDDEHYELVIHELPFNDDSVKQLNNIVSMIDKNRDIEKLISMDEMYEFLFTNIIEPNGILSIYVELVMSVLYYDANEIMIRYSDDPIDHQIALKNVIDRLDPKLSIFHNFSNKAINRIYTSKRSENLNHMYDDLINCYH